MLNEQLSMNNYQLSENKNIICYLIVTLLELEALNSITLSVVLKISSDQNDYRYQIT